MSDRGRPLVIWGASGQAKVLAEFAAAVGFSTVAVFDNNPDVSVSPIRGVPLFIGETGFDGWLAGRQAGPLWGVVAIGGAGGAARLSIQNDLARRGLTIATLVHPRSYVAESARVGIGTQLLAHSTICADAELGEACIVNTAASVDHECRVADGVHIGPGARLAGCVNIGRCAFVGVGAVVLPRIRIGCDSIIGAGAIVTKDVPDGAVVRGSPARVVRIVESGNGT